MSNKRGITLIALIITIIVMLILVAVTINVALNGGLFTKARDAADQTQVEADRESLLMAAMACVGPDGKIVFTGADGLDSNLPAGFSGSNGTYTKGGYTFTVNAVTGEIVATKTNSGGGTPTPSGNLSDLEKYILGAGGTGRNIMQILTESMQFQDDSELTPSVDESSAVTMAGFIPGENENTAYMYIRYNSDGNVYRFKMVGTDPEDMTSYSTQPISESEKIVTISTTDTNVGKTATIDGEKYIVLYGAGEKGSNVQLISSNTLEVGNVYIGNQDREITWTDSSVISAADIFNDTESRSRKCTFRRRKVNIFI